jgi:hypothetical protein
MMAGSKTSKDGMGSSNVGPGCLFDRLPEHIIVDILARDAEINNGMGDSDLRRLCQYRTVCKRFKDIVHQAGSVSCKLDEARLIEMRLIRFLQESERVETLIVRAPAKPFQISNVFLCAFLGASKSLTALRLSGGTLCTPSSDESVHELFRTMSGCPHLKSLNLHFCGANIKAPVRAKHQLRSLSDLSISKASINDKSMASVLKLCPALTALSLAKLGGLKRLHIACDAFLQGD